jgi:hypothetical protein
MILIEARASTEFFVVTPEQKFFPHGVETSLILHWNKRPAATSIFSDMSTVFYNYLNCGDGLFTFDLMPY